MNVNEILKLYKAENYNACLNFFQDNPSAIDKQSNFKLENIDESTKQFLYQNNSSLCHAVIKHSRTGKNWADSMNNFVKLHSNYRSLKVIPLELEMNVVHNMLWWLWVKPQTLQYKTLPVESVLKSVCKCLNKVLKTSHELVLGQEQCNDLTSVVSLLKRASDQLLCVSPVVCVQLLDIITMTVHVLLRQRQCKAVTECMSMTRKAIDQLELIRLHTGRETNEGNEVIYFKFGLARVNSTASLKNSRDSLDAFVITGSIVCAVSGEFEHAMGCLKQIPESEDNQFQFLVNYLKAHYCLQSGHLDEAKLCLAHALSSPLPPQHQAYYRLLLSRLLSEQGDHQAALSQCEAALASSHCQPELSGLTAHLAATQAQKLHLSTVQLNHLKKLVECLKQSQSQEGDQFEGFEEYCLSILSRQFSVSLLEALYILARQMFLAGYHVKSLDSYREVLEFLKTEVCEPSQLLPRRVQVLQEAVLAHVKANDLAGGEQLCRQLVREHVPARGGTQGESRWEAALYGLDEDVVSMILLADILNASEKRKSLEELNRCYSALSEFQDRADVNSDTEKELCNWFLSRVLLRKARLSRSEEAAHYFHRALMHKPGDKEVMFHYKQWALWHPDHQSFDPGDRVEMFPVDQLQNLALRHVLGCSVSEEEWLALFDQESSHNVLESLFDDDD